MGCCREEIGVAVLLRRIDGPLGFLTAAFFWLVSLLIFLALLVSLFGASTSSLHFLSISFCRDWISCIISHSWTPNLPISSQSRKRVLRSSNDVTLNPALHSLLWIFSDITPRSPALAIPRVLEYVLTTGWFNGSSRAF